MGTFPDCQPGSVLIYLCAETSVSSLTTHASSRSPHSSILSALIALVSVSPETREQQVSGGRVYCLAHDFKGFSL